MIRSTVQLGHLMTFRQLARDGNFTRAAEALHVTQPAVTQQIRALERHFRVRLVDIVGRRMQLTPAGAFLRARVDALLGSVDALDRDMREYADVERGDLRLGATVTIGSHGLAQIVARFRDRYPRITLDVRVENTQRIADDVIRGALSLALVEGILDDPALDIVPYQTDELVLVAAPSHRLATLGRPIGAHDLVGEDFVGREPGSGTRALVDGVLAAAGVVPRIVLAMPTGEGIIEAVEARIGIAIVSTLVTRGAVAAGRVRQLPLRDLDFRRRFLLVRLKGVTPSPAALAFAAITLASNENETPRKAPRSVTRRARRSGD